MKKVTLKMDIGTANAVREAVYQAQKGYSAEYPPIRIVNLREVLQTLDDQIEDIDIIE
jgi:hypothetical protein